MYFILYLIITQDFYFLSVIDDGTYFDQSYNWINKSLGNEEDPSKLFSCPNCNKRFGNPRSVKRHRKACEGNYDLRCSICGKGFYRQDKLKLHMAKNHRIFPL